VTIRDENCWKICKNFDELEEDEKVLIRESYDFMKDILKPADEVKEELAWPFKLDAKGEPNEALKDMEKDYIKSMTSIPGSARHEGFTLSVLGRFPKFWRDCVLRAIRITRMLITRIVAREIKFFTRLPIPKPEQIRPIALIDDIYSFLCTIVAKYIVGCAGATRSGIILEGVQEEQVNK